MALNPLPSWNGMPWRNWIPMLPLLSRGALLARFTTVVWLLIVLSSSVVRAGVPWAILGFSAGRPRVFSIHEMDDGSRYRAYRLDDLTTHQEATVIEVSKNHDSRLYDASGSNDCWEGGVTEGGLVPRGTLWICFPMDWSLSKQSPAKGKLRSASGQKGTIRILKRSEGIELIVVCDGVKESAYYSLGYGIEP